MSLPKELIVEEWFKKASDDERAVKLLLQHEDAPLNAVGFHCEQIAEKYLKAFLVARKQSFPKIHPLDRLLQYCATIDPNFEEMKADAIALTDYYTDTRYPEDYAELTKDECEEAFEAALRIKEFVLKKIGT